MPTVAGLAPEPGMPDKKFLLDGAEHNEDEAECGELRQDTKGDPEPAGQFGNPQKPGEPRARSNTFAPGYRIARVTPAAPDEHPADQEPHEEQGNIIELVQPGQRHMLRC